MNVDWSPNVARLVAATMIAFALPMPVQAFGLRTHLWMGQQLIDELNRDGCGVKFRNHSKPEQPDLRQKVPDGVCNAILNKPAAFLAGTLGPDAFPDILFGQTVIHPGLKERPFDAWLRLLLARASSDEEIAFAYGVAVHASGDIFAHTYVNNYAGDIFSLTDGKFSDVEHRHMLIEKYIDRHMPARSVMTAPAVPVDFVRRTLIFNDEAAVNAPGAISAIAFRKLLTYARQQHTNTEGLTAAAAEWKQIELDKTRRTWIGLGYKADPTTGLDREDPALQELPKRSQLEVFTAFERYRLAVQVWRDAEATSAFALGWISDIEGAADAYVVASLQTAERIVAAGDTGQTVETIQSAMLPIERWFTCYKRVLVGYPISAIAPICSKLDAFATNVDLSNAQTLVALPTKVKEIYLLWKAADKRVSSIQRRLALAIPAPFDPTRITTIVREFADPAGVYPGTLNRAFKKARSGQIALPCASALIDADLGLRTPDSGKCDTVDSTARIDPDRFVALRHAMTLARLALLDQDGTRNLAEAMGGKDSLQLGDGAHYSVIVDMAISIDGNQQWSGQSMPYPRERGYKPVQIMTKPYGHGPGDPPGFPFYQTEGLRFTAMTALFGAPFEGAILDRPEMQVSLYPFKPCKGDPFRPKAASAPVEVCAKPIPATIAVN